MPRQIRQGPARFLSTLATPEGKILFEDVPTSAVPVRKTREAVWRGTVRLPPGANPPWTAGTTLQCIPDHHDPCLIAVTDVETKLVSIATACRQMVVHFRASGELPRP